MFPKGHGYLCPSASSLELLDLARRRQWTEPTVHMTWLDVHTGTEDQGMERE